MGLASNALGCHPGLYARDPDIGELRSLVIPPNQSNAPSLAQPCNLVLSLSKHAWSPRPALRQAQGEVANALILGRHRESGFSLIGGRS